MVVSVAPLAFRRHRRKRRRTVPCFGISRRRPKSVSAADAGAEIVRVLDLVEQQEHRRNRALQAGSEHRVEISFANAFPATLATQQRPDVRRTAPALGRRRRHEPRALLLGSAAVSPMRSSVVRWTRTVPPQNRGAAQSRALTA